MGAHHEYTGRNVHPPHTRTYANIADRTNDVPVDPEDPLLEAIHATLKILVRQESPLTYYTLETFNADPTLNVWQEFGGTGGASELPFDAITDPAVDAAVTTAKVDVFSGTVVTLTAAGNSQTIGAPTDITAGRKFFVINNDTSNNTLTVNGVALTSGQYAEFRWDGTAWLFTTGGAAAVPGGLDGHIQYNNGGVFGGDVNHVWDDINKKETVVGDLEQVGGTPALLYTPTQVSATAVGANPRFAVVQANFLYVCDANDNNLRIYDVTDPAAPTLINATPLVIGGGRGVDIAGRYLYYADEDNGGRLVIVDVIDKSSPVVVGSIVTGGAARGIKVQGRFVFVTYNTTTNGLRSFDVSDPTNPILLDTRNTNSPGRTDIDISGNILVLPGSAGIQFIDISDPTNLLHISSVGGNSHTAKFQGRYLYTSDEVLDEFQIWDIASNILFPVKVGTLALVAPASVRATSISGNFAYIVDASNNDMLVIDVSDPTAPVAISTAVAVGLNPIAIITVGRYAYVLDNNGDQFLIMDVGGIEAQNLNVGNIDAGNINLRRDLKMDGVLSAGSGTFGAGGLNSDGEIAAAGYILAGRASAIRQIRKESDFIINGSVIELENAKEYVVMESFSTDKRIRLPESGGGFSPTVIRSESKYGAVITSTGAGPDSLFFSTTGQGQLVLKNIRIEGGTGTRPFAVLTGNAQTELLLELDDCDIVDFTSGTVFTTCIFNANNASFFTGSGTFILIDCECNFADMFHANFTDTGVPALRIQSSAPTSIVETFLTVQDSKLSSQPNESFFMLHSNLIAGTTVRLNGVEKSPFTPGTGGFFASETGAITSLADSPGASGVRTLVNAAGHTIADGDTNIQSGFATQTQNNGTFLVSNVVPLVSYEIVAVFVATDTGTWTNNSLDQTNPKVAALDNPDQADSKTIGSFVVGGNTTATVITTQNVFVDLDLGNPGAVSAGNNERFTVTNSTTGEIRYDGLKPARLDVGGLMAASSSGGGQRFNVKALKNGSALPSPDDVDVPIEVGNNLSSVALGWSVEMVTNDLFRLQIANADGTSDITIDTLKPTLT